MSTCKERFSIIGGWTLLLIPLLLISTITSAFAEPIGAALRLPIVGGPTANDIRASHHAVLRLVAEDAKRVPSDTPLNPLDAASLLRDPAFRSGQRPLTLPFAALVTSPSPRDCGEPTPVPSSVGWAPQNEVNDGVNVTTDLLARLTGGPFDCTKSTCGIIVQDTTDTAWRRLAYCPIRVVNNVLGTPKSCETVALIRGSEVWLRILVDAPPACPASGFLKPSGGFGFTMKLDTSGSAKLFSKILETLFTSEPFKFATSTEGLQESDTFSGISGVASHRMSPILSGGFRELIEVEGRVSRHLVSQLLEVELSATLYVSKQNPGVLEEYRGPSDVQRQEYIDAFRKYALHQNV